MDDDMRRDLAVALGVTLAPEDRNPWELPISEDPHDWGVSVTSAFDGFPRVCERLAPASAFSLEIMPLNEIPFEGYENVVLDHRGKRAVMGIGFDHAILQKEMGRDKPRRRAHHVVRLSPIDREREQQPNVLSDGFKLDYSGMLWLFDDAEELAYEEALVGWRALMRASYDIGGGFWIVQCDDDSDAE